MNEISSEIAQLQTQRLEAIEQKIKSDIVSINESLDTIHGEKLYLHAGFTTFESYCKERLGFSQSTAFRRLSAAKTAKQVDSQICESGKNLRVSGTISTLEAIGKVSPSKRINVIEKATELAKQEGKELYGAKHVREAVKKTATLLPAETEKPWYLACLQSIKQNKEDSVGIEAILSLCLAFAESDKAVVVTSNADKSDQPCFDAFWAAYPPTNRRSKGDCRKAWAKAVKKADAKQIIAKAAKFAESSEGKSEYCPAPTPWLNQERWDDDPVAWDRYGKDSPKAIGAKDMYGSFE